MGQEIWHDQHGWHDVQSNFRPQNGPRFYFGSPKGTALAKTRHAALRTSWWTKWVSRRRTRKSAPRNGGWAGRFVGLPQYLGIYWEYVLFSQFFSHIFSYIWVRSDFVGLPLIPLLLNTPSLWSQWNVEFPDVKHHGFVERGCFIWGEGMIWVFLLGIFVLFFTGLGIDVPFWGFVSHHLHILVGNYIPNIWVMWNIGTFTNPCFMPSLGTSTYLYGF